MQYLYDKVKMTIVAFAGEIKHVVNNEICENARNGKIIAHA